MRHTQLKLRMLLSGTLVFGFYALFAWVLFQMGFGLVVVIPISVLFGLTQYKVGKWLAVRSANAEEIDPAEHPELDRMAERLADSMDIPKPRMLLGEMGTPNAFAVGRRNAGTVVLSKSLVELLDPKEVEAVMAHEFAHVKNRDSVMMVAGQSVAALLGYLTYFVLLLNEDVGWIVSWLISMVVQMIVSVFVLAISRYREYVADEVAAEHVGGQPLATGLAKIGKINREADVADPSGDVAALCIFGDAKGLFARLFASHPPMKKRIERVAPEIAAQFGGD